MTTKPSVAATIAATIKPLVAEHQYLATQAFDAMSNAPEYVAIMPERTAYKESGRNHVERRAAWVDRADKVEAILTTLGYQVLRDSVWFEVHP